MLKCRFYGPAVSVKLSNFQAGYRIFRKIGDDEDFLIAVPGFFFYMDTDSPKYALFSRFIDDRCELLVHPHGFDGAQKDFGSKGLAWIFLCSRMMKNARLSSMPQVKCSVQKFRSATQASPLATVGSTYLKSERSWVQVVGSVDPFAPDN